MWPLLASFLLINPRSGNASPTADELAAEARAAGVQTQVLQEGEDPAELARASVADVFGMAGGDGSLAPVAGVTLERDAAFVCIPFGTRNHFARDLGLDRDDPIGALRAFATGTERRIDVGRADERLFLNNVSLGVYARLVHRREAHRRRREAFARIRAWAILLTHRQPLGITIDGEAVESRLVLIANNAYAVELPSLGERERLNEGKCMCTRRAPSSRNVPVSDSSWTQRSIGSRPRSTVSPTCCKTPVEFRVEPGALRVLVPPPESG